MWRFARLKIWLLIAAVLDPEKDDTITCTFCVERTRKESNKDTGGPPVFQAPCFRMTLARMPTPIVWMFNICNLTIVLHWQQRLSMFTQPRNFFHRSLGWTWGWKVAQCVLTIARISGAVRQGLLRVCKRCDRALSFHFHKSFTNESVGFVSGPALAVMCLRPMECNLHGFSALWFLCKTGPAPWQFLQILWLWSYCPRTYQAGICLASLELIRLQSRWVRFFYRLVTSHWFICHLCRALAIATFSKSQVEKDAAESCANSINTSNKPTSSLLHLADLACWGLQLFPFASSLPLLSSSSKISSKSFVQLVLGFWAALRTARVVLSKQQEHLLPLWAHVAWRCWWWILGHPLRSWVWTSQKP